ncbi:MAG: membrane protein insertion efficiency factor YidD [Lentisphaerae bacterium]|nr:membrane protein insertion efficiency factor YidD [Lentisphaerota bacterium]
MALLLVRFYQRCLSPLKGGGCCRFTPSCSEYARVAIERYGFLRGGAMSLWRLLRCSPLYRGSCYDPVPEKHEDR